MTQPVFSGLRRIGSSFGTMLGRAAEGAAVTGAITGIGIGAQKAYDALTKTRDFKNMLSSPFNDDLAQHHEANPQKFNAAFTSLRTVNPAITKDPMTAGAYMRRVMQYDNAGATGVLVEALAQKDKMPVSPLLDSLQHGATHGVQHVFQDRAQAHRAEMDLGNVGARIKAELTARHEHPMYEADHQFQRELARDQRAFQREQNMTSSNNEDARALARFMGEDFMANKRQRHEIAMAAKEHNRSKALAVDQRTFQREQNQDQRTFEREQNQDQRRFQRENILDERAYKDSLRNRGPGVIGVRAPNDAAPMFLTPAAPWGAGGAQVNVPLPLQVPPPASVVDEAVRQGQGARRGRRR